MPGAPCGGFGGFKGFKGFKAGQMAAVSTLKNSWTGLSWLRLGGFRKLRRFKGENGRLKDPEKQLGVPTAGICCIEGAVALAAAGRKACLGGPAERLEGLRRLRPGNGSLEHP